MLMLFLYKHILLLAGLLHLLKIASPKFTFIINWNTIIWVKINSILTLFDTTLEHYLLRKVVSILFFFDKRPFYNLHLPLFHRYPDMPAEAFAEACPVCQLNCNCKSCLRMEVPIEVCV